MIFRRRETNDRLISLTSEALTTVKSASAEDIAAAQESLANGFVEWMVLNKIRRELRRAGHSLSGQIDWEAIGEFIKTIAPIIMEFLLLLLESQGTVDMGNVPTA